QRGEPLLSPGRLNVLIQNLIDGRPTGRLLAPAIFDLVRILVRHRSILLGDARHYFGRVATTMAGIASDPWLATKVGLIDGPDHQNHPAGSLLERSLVRVLAPVRGGFCNVTINTVHRQRRRKESH